VPGGSIFLDDVRAGDVGRHQVGRKLDALEGQPERLGQGPDEQRLRRAGHARDQAVPADQQRDEQVFDDIRLADDDLAYFGAQFVRRAAERAHQLPRFVGLEDLLLLFCHPGISIC
jgi:hypothetical protein